MDKRFIDLFKELMKTSAVSAETVMDYDEKHNDKDGFAAANQLRDDFLALYDKINDSFEMTKTDARTLLIGALITVSQLVDKVNNLKKAISGYQSDLIPKLQEIWDNATSDEEAIAMANEKFVIVEEKEKEE